ncbi:MAG TPA: DUF6752 domain-containing protein [Marmoricola sp.]|nr:DUF6752 domain-containing protein [Marmoricola sp.]
MPNGLQERGQRARAGLKKLQLGAPATRREVNRLRRRVADLENEIQETRRLNRRVAEITDIVQELLVPIAQRDEAKLREQLDRYSASL